MLNKKYLMYYMQSESYYNQLGNSVTGTTRKRISRKNLGQVLIKVPNKVKQEEVIKILDNVTGIIRHKKKELEELDILIKARLNKIAARWPAKAVAQFSTPK